MSAVSAEPPIARRSTRHLAVLARAERPRRRARRFQLDAVALAVVDRERSGTRSLRPAPTRGRSPNRARPRAAPRARASRHGAPLFIRRASRPTSRRGAAGSAGSRGACTPRRAPARAPAAARRSSPRASASRASRGMRCSAIRRSASSRSGGSPTTILNVPFGSAIHGAACAPGLAPARRRRGQLGRDVPVERGWRSGGGSDAAGLDLDARPARQRFSSNRPMPGMLERLAAGHHQQRRLAERTRPLPQLLESDLRPPPANSQEYLVSHQWQPTSQPWSRMKCAGVPAEGPSPWRERKTSLRRGIKAWRIRSVLVESAGALAVAEPVSPASDNHVLEQPRLGKRVLGDEVLGLPAVIRWPQG